MAGSVIDDVTDRKLQEIVIWLRGNYESITRACEAQGLPKPPPWDDPLP